MYIRSVKTKNLSNDKEYAKQEDPEKRWFYNPFVPDVVTIKDSEYTKDLVDVPWEDVATDVLVMEQQAWLMREGAKWHGYKSVKDDFAMIDPSKLMLLTPGINTETNEYNVHGVPAPMLGKYMRSRGIVHEKTDFNLILFLITPGIGKFTVSGTNPSFNHSRIQESKDCVNS